MGEEFVTSDGLLGLGCHPRGVQHTYPAVRPTFRITAELFQMDMLYILGCLMFLALVDIFFASRTKARWWVLHLVGNAVVVVTALPDFWKTLVDPANALLGVDYSVWPCYMVGAIHSYHLLAFRNLPLGDWVHHLLFGGVICTVGLVFNTGHLLAFFAFFLSGLPGGLDYLMLTLVKHELMTRENEKVWNARVNVWIRSPGTMFCAFAIYLGLIYAPFPLTPMEILTGLVTGILCICNGQYYMQVVVGNTHKKVRDYNC